MVGLLVIIEPDCTFKAKQRLHLGTWNMKIWKPMITIQYLMLAWHQRSEEDIIGYNW